MSIEEQLKLAEKFIGKRWLDTSLNNYELEVESAFINDANEVILRIKGKPLGCTVIYANEYFRMA